MHGVAQFDIASGAQKKAVGGTPTYTSVFSNTLCELARQDPTVVGITAAMPGGTGLDHFGKVLLRDMVSLYVCMFSMYVCTHTRVHTHTDIYTLSHHCVLWRAVRVCARA